MSKMVRINESIDKQLQSLLKMKAGSTRQGLIGIALDALMRELILYKSNAQYAALKKNPKEYAAFKKEIEEWDVTLGDGLEDFKDDKFE